MPLTLADLWQALGPGAWPDVQSGKLPLADVVVDSRLAKEGSLFVALSGEHTDGHGFVGDAFRRGAVAALVCQPVTDCVTLLDTGRSLDASMRVAPPVCLLTPETLSALQRLAAWWRSRHSGVRVVGVTGSVGKTTAKELIAAVLRRCFVTLKSPGNYNNEIGLPLTMLQLHLGVEWAVQEMGMYGLGEIARLAAIARPQVAVVTNVGPTHLERLGSIERIAQAKAEIVQALAEDGLAILNGDDAHVSAMAALTPATRVLRFGMDPGNDVWAGGVETRGLAGLKVTFHHGDEAVDASLPLLGAHSVYGALPAVALGLSVGMRWHDIIAGLCDPAIEARMRVVPGILGATILDDTYNANPTSTIAALDVLAEIPGRRIAVLGGMLELGSMEVEGHRQVGRRAADVVDVLVTVGQLARRISTEALESGMPAKAVHVAEDNETAAVILRQILRDGDVVLVKGSRGIAMEHVVARIRMAS
jgi:UDP-N-acetylmuramoyl-tripeptide--D-alanyl-D-alanine ligase